MNNLKGFEQFNEELKYDTYLSAGKKLRGEHPARAMALVRHADTMKKREYGEREYTLWPDAPVVLKSIEAKDRGYGIDFIVTFKDIESESMFSDRRFEFYYGQPSKFGKEEDKDFFYFRSDKDDFDGETTEYRLFSNRQDAMKFRKLFKNWLIENGYEKTIDAFDRMSTNKLYSTGGRWGKNHPLRQELKHRFPSYD